MKKVIAICAALALILCGCATSGQNVQNTQNKAGFSIDIPDGAELFDEIMGFKGYVVNVSEADSDWYELVYHADMDGKDVIIGESFGYGDPQDYVIDLNRDGESELVCNCTFGGDGVQRVYTYRLVDGEVQVGTVALEDWTAGYTGPESAVVEAYLPDNISYYVAYQDADGKLFENYFPMEDLVWKSYEPTKDQ